ncbi:acetyl-CoA hydrolase/transferase C-terminal domain-containing protein [Paraburkholderia rhynchosiae]|nr:acetyl-CoA hydrolase/transferase C-terminal domain-containing protein [Paraburkholderia rhynchosiae]CAB3744600.1 hypothetical protein LMG27174_07211 [Paraburkholderia rhynchosiae]
MIALNTALAFDIFGSVNSTHNGRHAHGERHWRFGDFSHNASCAIFATKSMTKGGCISGVVPTVSHCDHNKHDIDVLAMEQGLTDLHGLVRATAPLSLSRVACFGSIVICFATTTRMH